MKKKLSVILCLVIVIALALTGCGGEKSKFIGKWEADIDMIDYVKKGFATQKDMAEYIELDSFKIAFVMEFDKDGTYKQYVDEDAVEDMLKTAKAEIKSGMIKYFEDYLKDKGINMTVDELLKASNTDLDKTLDDSFGDKFIDSLAEKLEGEGNFVVKDGKLFLSDGVDYAIEEDKYQTYEIEGSTLKILDEFGFEDSDDDEDSLYPLTFKKVG